MKHLTKGRPTYVMICAASAGAIMCAASGCDDDNVIVAVVPDGGAGVGGTGGGGGTGGSVDGGGTGGAMEGGVSAKVTMTALTSDTAGSAANADPNLVNPWGLAINPSSTGGPAFWIANEATGTATVYDQTGKARPVKLTIPVPGDPAATSEPTGQVFNNTSSFLGDLFIISTTQGAIIGVPTATSTAVRVDNSASEARYTGLTFINVSGVMALAAPDFHNNKIDMFAVNYEPRTPVGDFKDPDMPADFAPFNVEFLKGNVYVTYAKQDAAKEEEEKGSGLGYVSVFQFDGIFTKRLVTQGALNAPWALAIAPSSFGALADTLLVGNFGDGTIHAYDTLTGDLVGTLADDTGKPIAIDGLWAVVPGPKTEGLDLSQTLFFTAGPDDETHGVFGKLDVATK